MYNILGGNYHYGNLVCMKFIQHELQEFINCYGEDNKIDAFLKQKVNFDDDSINADCLIELPYCYMNWLYADGKLAIYIENRSSELPPYIEKYEKYILFADFDTNIYYHLPEDMMPENYRNSILQVYDYLKYVYCPRLIAFIKNFYDKRLHKEETGTIKRLEGEDYLRYDEAIQ